MLTVNQILSRGCPAYTNDNDFNAYPASRANDGDYSTQWRTQQLSNIGSAYLAYDVSGVSKTTCVVVWYNCLTGDYDFQANGAKAYNQAKNYTIDANTAPGGILPTSGWVTLVSVTGNPYHSRQHAVDLTGYNWVRINVTDINGATYNYGVSLNMDVHGISSGNIDNWVFYGDSITANGCGVNNDYGVGTIAQLIHAGAANFPLMENGGIGGRTAAYGAANIATWLPFFSGQYVSLNYGTNDANQGISASSFHTSMVSMITQILNVGKIPVIPHIPWGNTSAIKANGPALNAVIDGLYTSYPSIVRGPDLWAYFQAHPSYISGDGIHPTSSGYAAYRQQWASTLLTEVYA